MREIELDLDVEELEVDYCDKCNNKGYYIIIHETHAYIAKHGVVCNNCKKGENNE